jgi:hypothetical protein
MILSGGSGAGAQPGPAAPATASVSAPVDGARGGATGDDGVRAAAEKIGTKTVKIRERGPGTFTRARVDGP